MAGKERLESLTGIENDVQVTERIKHAMENYFSWFQNAMSASPWSNVDLNKNSAMRPKTLPLLSDLYRNLAKLKMRNRS